MADSPNAAVVNIRGLVKTFRHGVIAVDGLDLVVEPGQILGLAGPNGSGKSVTIRSLLGLLRPTAGRICLFGEPLRPGSPVLGRVGALVDGPGFVPHLSGRKNLLLAARSCGRRVTVSDLDAAVGLAALGPALDRPYATYSHGMRYRLGLARSLLGEPELLLLDEATTGLDPLQGREVRRRIAEVCAEYGTTVVYAAHQLGEVEEICTHVAVMRRGRLVVNGPLGEILGVERVLQVDTPEASLGAQVLESVPAIRSVRPVAGRSIICAVDGRASAELVSEVVQRLDTAGVEVRAVYRGQSLDLLYYEVLAGSRIAAERDMGQPDLEATDEEVGRNPVESL